MREVVAVFFPIHDIERYEPLPIHDRDKHKLLPIHDTDRDVNVLIFQKNDRFVMETTTKNRKRNDRF